MLIFNHEQRLRAGMKNLSKRCSSCSKALSEYPLIMNDDAGLAVFHAACAAGYLLKTWGTYLGTPPLPKKPYLKEIEPLANRRLYFLH